LVGDAEAVRIAAGGTTSVAAGDGRACAAIFLEDSKRVVLVLFNFPFFLLTKACFLGAEFPVDEPAAQKLVFSSFVCGHRIGSGGGFKQNSIHASKSLHDLIAADVMLDEKPID